MLSFLLIPCSSSWGRGANLWNSTADQPHHVAHRFQKENTPASPWLPQTAKPQLALRESRPQEPQCNLRANIQSGWAEQAWTGTHVQFCVTWTSPTKMREAQFSSWVRTGKSLTCTADLNYVFCIHSAGMQRGVLHTAWVWNMHRDCHRANERSALLMVKEDFLLMM